MSGEFGQVETPLDAADIQALSSKLRAFNIDRAAINQGQQLGIFQRDETGDLVAGIYGWLWGDCLEIAILWIHEELRGQGLGQRLLTQLEAAGKERGARRAILDTFTFQAPGFYERMGYETFGLVEGYGGQNAKHFMRKELA